MAYPTSLGRPNKIVVLGHDRTTNQRKDSKMKAVTRLATVLIVTSLLAGSLANGESSTCTSAKIYCSHKGYCARMSNSRIRLVDPQTGVGDPMLHFDLVDGSPLR